MSKKILIVEDEEALLDMYKLKFEQAGYQVIVAEDGLSGLELARKELPDLILLDLILPEMDGYQVLGELKKDDRTKKIKVYIISNLGQNDEINKSFNSGANGYLIKANLTPSQLIEKVNQIFNGQEVGVKRAGVVVNKKQAIKPAETLVKKDQSAQFGSSEPARIKILLIEDEEVIVNMYKLRFAKAGYEVETALNGAWGLKIASQKPFDIIIMDMVMPAMFGSSEPAKIKILLIEDEEVIVNMYKLRFIKAGYEVETARNGAWGLKLANQKPFDIIIMDMVMPAMDGYEAIKRLKSDDKTKNIPVIVISNSAQDADIERAKQCGAVNYLLKSQITPARLVKEVEKFVKK